MNMYEELNKETTLDNISNKDMSLSDAYEKLYRRVVRLEDMDDFTLDMLTTVRHLVLNNIDIKDAFLKVIGDGYPFADDNYFKEVVTDLIKDLSEILYRSLDSEKPEDNWKAEIDYLAKSQTIEVGGVSYTLSTLRNKIERRITNE